MSYDDYDDYDDRPVRSRRKGGRRRPRASCPYCGHDGPPAQASRVSSAGWVVVVLIFITMFLLGLFTCFISWLLLPFSMIGLLVREHYRICPDCGATL